LRNRGATLVGANFLAQRLRGAADGQARPAAARSFARERRWPERTEEEVKLRIGQKAQRMVAFLVGLGDPRVQAALARFGLSEGDIDEGWNRLRALSKVPVRFAPEAPAVELVGALDAWENQWFPIIEVVLRTSHPEVHEVVFLNLTQTEGPQVVVSVRTLLDRLEAMVRPKDEGGLGDRGEKARAHLTRRGVSDEVLAEARALLARVGKPPSTDEPIVDPEARAAAEAHMWSWYLEWSGIARAAIKDRNLLAVLGFGRAGRRTK